MSLSRHSKPDIDKPAAEAPDPAPLALGGAVLLRAHQLRLWRRGAGIDEGCSTWSGIVEGCSTWSLRGKGHALCVEGGGYRRV
jgi:hypothetical protein